MSHFAPAVSAYAENILQRINIFNNPYFQQLQTGAMSFDVFRETQVQFFYAVDFFSRPMTALVGRIQNYEARLSILKNILEEHGDMNLEHSHTITFKRFLETLGCETLDFSNFIIWPQLRAFNSVLTTSCTLDEVEVGIACMGIIERAFVNISSIIAESVTNHGWVKSSDLFHYKLHSSLDLRHAADFFAILEPCFEDPTKQYFVKQGLELGAYIFDRLYRDLITYRVNA